MPGILGQALVFLMLSGLVSLSSSAALLSSSVSIDMHSIHGHVVDMNLFTLGQLKPICGHFVCKTGRELNVVFLFGVFCFT